MLSDDLLLQVFVYLDAHILQMPKVCQRWHYIATMDTELLESSWDAVLVRDISCWDHISWRCAELKLLVADLVCFAPLPIGMALYLYIRQPDYIGHHWLHA